MSGARRLGAHEEDRAASHLLAAGFVLVSRRVKTRSGEIDLVALDGEELVFVEVKHRARGVAEAEMALDPKKMARLSAAAQEYVDRSGDSGRPSRFDLLVVTGTRIHHHRDAWRP